MMMHAYILFHSFSSLKIIYQYPVYMKSVTEALSAKKILKPLALTSSDEVVIVMLLLLLLRQEREKYAAVRTEGLIIKSYNAFVIVSLLL